MPRLRRPLHAELITECDQLRFYARKFAQGLYNCLIFVGPPGRLKSSIIEAETKGQSHLISGHAMPFEVFCEAQEHKDVPLLIIDDADGLYGKPQGQRLLKALTNPRTPKRVPWTSNAPVSRGLLKVFETNSKVCVIDNAWNTQNEHIAALEDRARLFLFDPPPAEVHKEMGQQNWFGVNEIYQFVGDSLCFFTDLSARSYVKAAEAKVAGEDWRAYLLRACIDKADMNIILLEYEAAWRDRSVEEKAEEFQRRVGMCRATYFNRKRNLLPRMVGHPLAGRWSLGG
jgi:hypothetical protein